MGYVLLGRSSSGLNLLRSARENPRFDGMAILMMSGAMKESEAECLAAGAYAFLEKPFSGESLRGCLEEAILLRKAARTIRGASILHFEDDDGWADLVRIWLHGVGAQVQRFACAGDLWKDADSLNILPDVILMDLSLPGKDGLQLSEDIKRSPVLQRAPIIALSSQTRARVAAMTSRAVQFVKKDGRCRSELLLAISTVIDQHRCSRGRILNEALGIEFESTSGQVRQGGKLVATLGGRHSAVFQLLLERSPKPVSRSEILCRVSGKDAGVRPSRLADNYISAVRQLLSHDIAKRIVNIVGVGYALIDGGHPPLA